MMDELEQLRMFRGDVPEPRPDQVETALAGFMNVVALEEGRSARKARPRRPWLVAAVAAAVVLVVAVPAVLPEGSPGGARVAAAGVGFTPDGKYLIATIDDPTASAAEMQAAFAQNGFDIQVQLQPASPSLVGMIPFRDGEEASTPPSLRIQDITTPCAAEPVYGCPTGIRIPMGYSDHAAIVVTRAAAPGEKYLWPADAYALGEVLHCSGLRGMTVADASPILQGLGLVGRWQIFGHAGGDGVSQTSVADYVINQASTYSSDTVEFTVSPTPLTPADINLPPDSANLYYRQIKSENQGC